MKVGLAQVNPKVGDIDGNTGLIIGTIKEAMDKGVDLLLFPEQCITGYPVQDLIFVSGFVEDNVAALDTIAREVNGELMVVVGFIEPHESLKGKYYNSAAVIKKGAVMTTIRKQLLPNYDVFDELRYFTPGAPSMPVNHLGIDFGITICEDIWDKQYDRKVVAPLVESGAKLIVSINASPFHKRKILLREEIAREKATSCRVPIVYLNMVGGQDEITFDGNSFAMDPDGTLVFRAPAFEEGLFTLEVHQGEDGDVRVPVQDVAPLLSREEEIFKALSLNLRDYYRKIGVFKGILLGLSGGIDSAFTATVAVDAVGPENVTCIYMPTRFNSDDSLKYSKKLCENLGCEFIVFPIERVFEAYESEFNTMIENNSFNVADENLQARIRGNILMYYSNKFGKLLVSTGNKSEISTGYCTLYGDTCGGKNVPGDLFKMELFDVCKKYINRDKEVIPEFIISRPPTAELRENQKDEDSLPPYHVLDKILEPMIEEFKSVDEIIAMGFDAEMVWKVHRLVKIAEFKRAQLVQTIKITPKAFGIGRRVPIVNGYK